VGTTVENGGYYNLSGTWQVVSGWSSISKELVPGRTYDREGFSHNPTSETYVTFYDEEGTLISGINTETFTVPETAKTTKLAINTVKIATARLCERRSVDKGLILT